MPTKLCPYCFRTANWSRRDRTSFGWFCPNHRSPHHPPHFFGYLGRVLDPLSDPSVALLALRARYRVRFVHDTRCKAYASYERINYYDLVITNHGDGWHGWYFSAAGPDARKVLLDAARVLL